MQAPWRIECFGGLKGISGEIAVSRFRTRKAALLLAYLAIHKDRSHPREELGGLLWPDADDAALRARLRLALATLRPLFEEEGDKGQLFLASGDTLQLNPRLITTDVEEFESLLASAAKTESDSVRMQLLEQAVGLYRGELLPGFIDEWVLGERARLSEAFELALTNLVDLCASLSLPDLLLTHARRLLALDPWQERVHCRVMRALIDAGNPRAALRQFDELSATLAELGETPGKEALQLAEAAKEQPLVVARGALAEGAVSSGDERRGRLPLRSTRFFGREGEREYSIRSVAEGPGRLLTLTGPGGSGKTRLSIEAGYALQEMGWQVWFVPLADVGTPNRIYDAILTQLKIGKGQDPVNDLARFFRHVERPLLILDNLEHLMDDAAEYVGRLLSEAENLKCIVTSRQTLAIEGERELTVPPLPAPEGADVSAEGASAFPSVQLYVDRCQAIRPDYLLSNGQAGDVSMLCARLEGIPLAIEIAASLSRTLGPGQVVEQLGKRLDLLVSPRRDISHRQKTLRNTIAYSYDLLSPPLAQFFVSLSVFRGGWTVESAEAICLAGDEDALGLLTQLRERSLVETYETPKGDLRFRMLEAFREFGQERISDSRREELDGRFDAYFLRLAEEAFSALGSPREQVLLTTLQDEYDNLMHVFERALQRRDSEFGIRLAAGFGQVWRSRGAVIHERSIIERFADLPETGSIDPMLQMRALNLVSHSNFLLCDWERSLRAEQRTFEIAASIDNHEFMAVALGGTAMAYVGLRRNDDALSALLEAVEHAKQSTNPRRITTLVGNLAVVYWNKGDLDNAETLLREALTLAKEQQSEAQANHITLNIARVLLDKGRLDEAMEILPLGLDRATKFHRSHDVITGLAVMARYYRLAGEFPRAWALTQIALQRVFSLHNERSEVYVAIEAGLELLALERYEEATPVLAMLTKHHLSIGDAKDVESALARCREVLGEDSFAKSWAAGIAQGVGEGLRLLVVGG